MQFIRIKSVYGSFNRYPMPQTVSIRFRPLGDWDSFRRTLDMCVSIVRSSTLMHVPHTVWRSSSRRKTLPGSEANRHSSANSVGVNLTCFEASVTSCRDLSMARRPMTIRVLSFNVVASSGTANFYAFFIYVTAKICQRCYRTVTGRLIYRYRRFHIGGGARDTGLCEYPDGVGI